MSSGCTAICSADLHLNEECGPAQNTHFRVLFLSVATNVDAVAGSLAGLSRSLPFALSLFPSFPEHERLEN